MVRRVVVAGCGAAGVIAETCSWRIDVAWLTEATVEFLQDSVNYSLLHGYYNIRQGMYGEKTSLRPPLCHFITPIIALPLEMNTFTT